MTRPAAAITFEFDDAPGLWTVRLDAGSLLLGPEETRCVLPWDYSNWFADEAFVRRAGWFARLLRVKTAPTELSTAVRIVVRLGVKQGRVYRRWVAFSQVERDALRALGGVPEAQERTTDGACVYDFSADEAPLRLTGPVELVECEELSPFHAYVPNTRPPQSRVLDLVESRGEEPGDDEQDGRGRE